MADIIDIVLEDKWITPEAKKLAEYLINSGTIPNMQIKDTQVREVIRKKRMIAFHNTELLLKNYRDIAWELEYAPYEIAANLDYSCDNISEIIQAFDYEFALGNKSLEYRLDRLEESVKMFKALNEAVTLLKKKPTKGELYYDIIYHTFIDPSKKSIDEILDMLYLKRSVYYTMRKEAISMISARLWYSMPARQVGMVIEAIKTDYDETSV